MTIEKLKRGTEILDKIKHLRDEKAMWEQSTYIKDLNIARNLEDRTILCIIDTFLINFRRLKDDTLNTINKRIKEYQEEFDNL